MYLNCFQRIGKGSLQTATKHKLIKVWRSFSEDLIMISPSHLKPFSSCAAWNKKIAFSNRVDVLTLLELLHEPLLSSYAHQCIHANCLEVWARRFHWDYTWLLLSNMTCPGWRDNFLSAQKHSLKCQSSPESLARSLVWGLGWKRTDISSYMTTAEIYIQIKPVHREKMKGCFCVRVGMQRFDSKRVQADQNS